MSGHSIARDVAVAVTVAAMIGTTAACGTSGGAVNSSTSTTAATSATTQAAGVEPFTGLTEPVSGTKGNVTYTADLPQVRGGNPAARERFNSGMRAALDDHLESQQGKEPATITPGTLESGDNSAVTHIGTGAVAGVLLLNTYVKSGAYPFNTVSTTVIDAQTAEPIMIGDLFDDETAGLAELADAIKVELAGHEVIGSEHAPKPVAEQLANWVPGKEGLTVFIEVPHALGDLHKVDIGWNQIADVLKPGMQEKLST